MDCYSKFHYIKPDWRNIELSFDASTGACIILLQAIFFIGALFLSRIKQKRTKFLLLNLLFK